MQYIESKIFFDEFIVSPEKIIRVKYDRKIIEIKWSDITKMSYSRFDFFIHLYGNDKKISIYIRTSNIETLIKFVRDHLDEELTKKAL